MYEIFVYTHTETNKQMDIIHVLNIWEFFELRMWIFQSTVFIGNRTYSEVFESELIYF